MDYILNRFQINYILREQQEDIRQEKTCADFKKGSNERNLCDVLNKRKYLDITKPIINDILEEKKKKWNEIVSKEERDKIFNTLKILEKSEADRKWSYNVGNNRYLRRTIKEIIENRLPELYFIYDETNNWTYLNKLDTNYSDTAVLITDIFLKYKEEKILGVLDALSKGHNSVLEVELKDIQNKYKDDILKMIEINGYTANSKKNTKQGEEFEVYVKNFLEKQGYKLIHSGGDGDPIDFLLGIDLIMEKDNKIYTFQVKSVYTIKYESSTIMNPNTGAYKIYANQNLSISKPKNLDYIVFWDLFFIF